MENRETAAVPPEIVARRAQAAAEHRTRLIALARSRTSSAEDAEDVVAEAILRALEFEGLNEELLPNFLTSVTTRLCADLHARRSVALRHQHRLLAPPDVPSPEETVCDRSEAEWVSGMVATLPSRQRAVLEARACGESCESIARRYRMSYKAVESTLSRARATVRAAFASTLGLSAAAVVRHRRVIGVTTVAAASATGVALVAGPYLGPATGAEARSAQPPRVVRVADPPASPDPSPAAPLTPGPRPDPSPTRSRPPLPSAVPDWARPAPTPTRTLADVGAARVESHDDGYTTPERLGHCIEHGIDLDDRMLCRYPPPKS